MTVKKTASQSTTTTPLDHSPVLQNIGIFTAIGAIFTSVANAAVATSGVVNTTASALNELADTGYVMAHNNKVLVSLESEGKKQAKLIELKEKYPDMNIEF